MILLLFVYLYVLDILPHEQFPHSNTGEFLRSVVDELIDFIGQTHDRAQPVLEFHHPAQLRGNLDLDVPETPEHLAQLLSDVKDTCRYAVKSGMFGDRETKSLRLFRLTIGTISDPWYR